MCRTVGAQTKQALIFSTWNSTRLFPDKPTSVRVNHLRGHVPRGVPLLQTGLERYMMAVTRPTNDEEMLRFLRSCPDGADVLAELRDNGPRASIRTRGWWAGEPGARQLQFLTLMSRVVCFCLFVVRGEKE